MLQGCICNIFFKVELKLFRMFKGVQNVGHRGMMFHLCFFGLHHNDVTYPPSWKNNANIHESPIRSAMSSTTQQAQPLHHLLFSFCKILYSPRVILLTLSRLYWFLLFQELIDPWIKKTNTLKLSKRHCAFLSWFPRSNFRETFHSLVELERPVLSSGKWTTTPEINVSGIRIFKNKHDSCCILKKSISLVSEKNQLSFLSFSIIDANTWVWV